MNPTESVLQKAARMILSTWQEDGRFKVYPKEAIYPCRTIMTANTLCKLGYGEEEIVNNVDYQIFCSIKLFFEVIANKRRFICC
ncbi:hypothetical protein Q5O14_11165 [Eubacteriaceae bacterium ES2]|nr:hypothetical protein Q5O14_11165 [Eubacteriaceae bacterium ES2]